ncbi:MAG: SlyX family protein [Treponema sp.]|nr:SlyX family protein [Candidatus Treponema scatequi]
MTEKEVEDKFIALETKIAYLEEFTSELQNVVVEHTKTIDRLTKANKLMSEKITELIENSEEIPNRKPPHY